MSNMSDTPGIINTTELREYVERIERLEKEKADLAEGIRDVKKEAKDAGFDPKALAFVLSMRKKDTADLAVMHTYADALGVFG
jgi:uncharacterized protein (UPF0335 family)